MVAKQAGDQLGGAWPIPSQTPLIRITSSMQQTNPAGPAQPFCVGIVWGLRRSPVWFVHHRLLFDPAGSGFVAETTQPDANPLPEL